MGNQPSAGIALVVDDEEAERRETGRALRKQGYTVLHAAGYWEALEKFRELDRRVDCLICDVALPERNGCDLAIALSAEQPNLKVLFVSGKVGAEVCPYYGLDRSDIHFLVKPFTASQLLDRLRAVLKSSKRLRIRHELKTLTAGSIPA